MRSNCQPESSRNTKETHTDRRDIEDKQVTTIKPFDEPQACSGTNNRHDSISHLRNNRRLGAHSCELQHLGRVIHDGIDAGGLVNYSKENPDQQEATRPARLHDDRPLLTVTEPAALAVEFNHLSDLIDDGFINPFDAHLFEACDGLPKLTMA